MNKHIALPLHDSNDTNDMQGPNIGEMQGGAFAGEKKEISLLDAGEQVFILKTGANTSAGVYDRSGKLVRTLWSGKWMEAGTHPVTWDGKDDAGNTVTINRHTIKV